MKIRIGTRGSDLALWQAHHVADLLGQDQCEIVIIKTQGDRIQNVSFDKMEGKGFFTKEIEEALLTERVDLAVHSLKDLPTENPPGLIVGAIPERGNWGDLLLIRSGHHQPGGDIPLRKGAVVGTSSMRRLAQLRQARPDLTIEALRGNVNTRLRKLREGMYDAIVLAAAGMERLELDLSDLTVAELSPGIFLPAPGQGALGLQIRAKDEATLKAIVPLNHGNTARAVAAERAFLHHFGGGCHIPLGALAQVEGETITLTGTVASPEGTGAHRQSITGTDPEETGARLAALLKAEGADSLL